MMKSPRQLGVTVASFIKPSELSDDRLMYWADHYARMYARAQKALEFAQAHYEEFLAEVQERGLMDRYMRRRRG